MIITFEPAASRTMREPAPTHLNPIQWNQSLGLARQICARVFRDGGTPTQALEVAGVSPRANASWDKAVELIAESLAVAPPRQAA
jgi:hypothetical protein